MNQTDKVYRISIGENNKLDIVDMNNKFNELEKNLFLEGKFMAEGTFGKIYKCGPYVKKVFFKCDSVFALEEIVQEMLYFCIAYQFNIYLRFSRREWYLYLPRVGNFSLADLIKKNKYKFYDLTFPNYFSLLEEVRNLHAKGIAHLDISPPNVVGDFESDLHLVDFGLSLTEDAQHPTGSRKIATPLLGYLSSICEQVPNQIRLYPLAIVKKFQTNCRYFYRQFVELICAEEMKTPDKPTKILFQKVADYFGLNNIANELHACLEHDDFYLKAIYPQYKSTEISNPENIILSTFLEIDIQNIKADKTQVLEDVLKKWHTKFENDFINFADMANNIKRQIDNTLNSSMNAEATIAARIFKESYYCACAKNKPGALQKKINKVITQKNYVRNTYPIYPAKNLFPHPYDTQHQRLKGYRKSKSIVIQQEVQRMIDSSSAWKQPFLKNLLECQKEFNESFYFLALCNLNINKHTSLFGAPLTASCLKYIDSLCRDLRQPINFDKNRKNNPIEKGLFKYCISELFDFQLDAILAGEMKKIVYFKIQKIMSANKSPFYGINNKILELHLQNNQEKQFFIILYGQYKNLIEGKLAAWPPQSDDISLIEND